MAEKPLSPQDRLSLLGTVFMAVPSVDRPALKPALDALLKELGLDVEKHQFLLGQRFRQSLPTSGLGTQKVNLTRQLRYAYELVIGDAMRDRSAAAYATGYTSHSDIVAFVNRTDAMVRRYLVDRRYYEDGWVYLPHTRGPQPGQLRVRALAQPYEGETVSLFDAVKLAPDPLSKMGKYKRR